MASSFFERIDHLSSEVGHGLLKGTVSVNQVYSAPQERGFWETGPNAGVVIRNHPGGGGIEFLRNSLYEPIDAHMGKLAEHAITEEGSEIRKGMEDVVEDISRGVFERAPIEFGDLKASGHPTVTDEGEVVYDRPPNVGRLSRDDLRAKADVKRLFPNMRQP